MGSLMLDFRASLRGLCRNGGVTAAIIVTLALGIGANTAIFSVVQAVLLDPLPYPEADRLTFIWSDLPAADYRRAPISGPELDDLRRQSATHDDFGAIWASSATLLADGRPEPLRVGMVTSNFLSLLGVEPARGRWLEEGDEGEGVPPRIVISGDLWQRRFGSDESLLGRALQVDGGWGVPGGLYTVVGIMPPGFEMLLPGDSSVPRTVDVWLPFQHDLPTAGRGSYYLRTVGRLAAGATLDQAREELDRLGREIEAAHAEYAGSGRTFYPVSLHGDTVSAVRPALLALLGGTAFVLLIACANVAHLLLARAAERRREISMRAALGAGRRRIARQLVIESLALSTAGAAAGIALAYFCLEALAAIRPASLPRFDSAAINLPVLGFSLAVSLLCGLVFGMAPVWDSFRLDLAQALRAGGRGGERRRNRVHGYLVAAEIALAVVLLTGAGLLVRTFLELQKVDPGFDSHSVLTFQVSLPAARYSPAEIAEFTRELDRRLGALPAVSAAGAINQLPLSDLPNWSTPWKIRTTTDAEEAREADARVLTPGYFQATGARLLAGRWFDTGDDENAQKVVIVDPLLARQAWPGQSPLGQEIEVRLWSGSGFQPVWAEVVGVVAHVRHHQLTKQVRGQMFAPFAQGPRNQVAVAVRTATDPLTLVGPVREQIAQIDPDLALADVQPMASYVSRAQGGPKFRMALAATLAALALVLACLGIYGVLALAIAGRQREIGIRIALGGLPADIVRLFLTHGLRWIAAGVAVGVVASLAVNRLLVSLLFEVAPDDLATLIAVPLVLITVALAACYLPARRASLIDPARTLRSE